MIDRAVLTTQTNHVRDGIHDIRFCRYLLHNSISHGCETVREGIGEGNKDTKKVQKSKD